MNNISLKKIIKIGGLIILMTIICHMNVKSSVPVVKDDLVKLQTMTLNQKNSWKPPPIINSDSNDEGISSSNDSRRKEEEEEEESSNITEEEEQASEIDDNDVRNYDDMLNFKNDVAEIVDTSAPKTVEKHDFTYQVTDHHMTFNKNKKKDKSSHGKVVFEKPYYPERQMENHTIVHNNNNNTKPKTFIIVDIGCHQGLHIVLENIFRYANDHDKVAMWHSSKNEAFLKNGIEKHPILTQKMKDGKIRFHKIDPTDYGSVNANGYGVYEKDYWYSILLTNMDLWGLIDTEVAVTMQGDTIICHPLDESMIENFSYLGGPSPFQTYFVAERGKPGNPVAKKVVRIHNLFKDPQVDRIARFHMNGGFSIRNVTWVKQCIHEYGPLQHWTEDDLYNYCMQHITSSSIVTEDMSYATGSDNGNTKCFNHKQKRHCPYGVHKPWQMMEIKEQYKELEEKCPGLSQLRKRQKRFEDTTICNVQYLDESPTDIDCAC